MMFLASTASDINTLGAGVAALLGYGMVFVGLIALMLVVILIGKIFTALDKKKAAKTAAEMATLAVEPQPEEEKPVAPGSAGKLLLHDVEPKTAAMLMAIVADKMGKPINELRFISIKEVK